MLLYIKIYTRHHSSFVEGNHIYILMEHVDGESLLEQLEACADKGERVPESMIWDVFIQLTLGLTYLHTQKRVVHRDLTPANVMVDNKGVVKITDFGLARQKNPFNSFMKTSVGTISYSCPEIVKNEAYTDKADIWSLGCILYHMAALKTPFQGSNALVVAQGIVEGTFEPLPKGYSPLLEGVITKLLSKQAQQRPNIIKVGRLIAPVLLAHMQKQVDSLKQNPLLFFHLL